MKSHETTTVLFALCIPGSNGNFTCVYPVPYSSTAAAVVGGALIVGAIAAAIAGSSDNNNNNNNSSSGYPTITCNSKDNGYTRCPVDSRRGEVYLQRQLSQAGCWEGDTWGYDREGIWVDKDDRIINLCNLSSCFSAY